MRISDCSADVCSSDLQAAAVGLGNDGLFHFSAYNTEQQSWPAWTAMPALPQPRPVATLAVNANGAYVVFACDQDGAIWASTQTKPAQAADSGLPTWTAWQRLQIGRASCRERV